MHPGLLVGDPTLLPHVVTHLVIVQNCTNIAEYYYYYYYYYYLQGLLLCSFAELIIYIYDNFVKFIGHI
jgi:hypothetical protein